MGAHEIGDFRSCGAMVRRGSGLQGITASWKSSAEDVSARSVPAVPCRTANRKLDLQCAVQPAVCPDGDRKTCAGGRWPWYIFRSRMKRGPMQRILSGFT